MLLRLLGSRVQLEIYQSREQAKENLTHQTVILETASCVKPSFNTKLHLHILLASGIKTA